MNDKRLISHHKIGFTNNTIDEFFLANIKNSVNNNYEFAEFDVQITFDKKFIIYHDDQLIIDDINKPIKQLTLKTIQKNHPYIVEMHELLKLISGKKKAHVDLKFKSPYYYNENNIYEIIAIKEILQYLNPEDIIITTLEDESIKAIRKWSKNIYPNLLVGLSLGRTLDTNNLLKKKITYLSEYYAEIRLKLCDANLIVSRKDLASKRLLNLGSKMGIPVLVWTVDSENELNKFLNDERVWLLTTNKPDLALKIRDSLLVS